MNVMFLLLFLFLVYPAKIDAAVVVSEFYPNPTGDDLQGEWIELWNTGDETVVLNNWVISDVFGTTKSYSLNEIEIHAGQFFLLTRLATGITLNNDKEQILLRDGDGNEFFTPEISQILEGMSYSFFSDGWAASIPTPSETNQRLQNPTPTPSPMPTQTPMPSPSTQSTSTPLASASAQLHLTEIRACGDTTEWVEVFNFSNISDSGTGWNIRDAAGNTVKLDSILFPKNEFTAIDLQKKILNNSGDVVSLYYYETKKESVSYSLCNPLLSYSKGEDNEWNESQPTKGVSSSVSEVFTLQTDKPLNIASSSAILSAPTQQSILIQYALPEIHAETTNSKTVMKKKNKKPPVEFPIDSVLSFYFITAGASVCIPKYLLSSA